jgi:hypothetical protein
MLSISGSSPNGDGRVDQVAAQRAQSGERAILVNRGETAESNHIGGEDRRDLSIFAHGAPSPAIQIAQERLGARA